jgi:hypothetical protein
MSAANASVTLMIILVAARNRGFKLASAKTPMSAQQLDDLTQKLADSPLKRALGKIQAKRQNVSKRALTDKAKSNKK